MRSCDDDETFTGERICAVQKLCDGDEATTSHQILPVRKTCDDDATFTEQSFCAVQKLCDGNGETISHQNCTMQILSETILWPVQKPPDVEGESL